MSEPMLPTNQEIATAAIMRGFGQSWAAAARLGWPVDHILLWQFQFPEIWNYFFHYAMKRHAQIAAAEAVEVLQREIRQSNCEKTQLAIARTLRQYRERLRKRESRDK